MPRLVKNAVFADGAGPTWEVGPPRTKTTYGGRSPPGAAAAGGQAAGSRAVVAPLWMRDEDASAAIAEAALGA